MKKILIVSILLTLVVSSGTFASSARWNALGGEHRFVIDTSNYGIYPGRVTLFGNALFVIPVANFLDNDVVSGVLVNATENMTLAYHYNIASTGAKNLRKALAGFAGQNDRLAALNIKPFPDLFWGMKMGKTSLGVRLALAMDSISDAATIVKEDIMNEAGDVIAKKTGPMEEITTSAKALDLSLGATMYGTPVGDLDLGLRVGIQSFSEDNLNDDIEITSTGGMDLAFDARLNKPLGETYTLVPLFSLNVGSLPSAEYHEVGAPNVAEVSYMKSDIGVGLRNKVKDKGMLVVGVVGGYNTTTYKPITTIVERDGKVIISREKKEMLETTDTGLSATFLAGYEHPITKWLIARGGTKVKFNAISDEVATQEKVDNYIAGEEDTAKDVVGTRDLTTVGYYYNMGLRTIFKGVIIDLIFARNIAHRGPYFLTGAAGNWATNVCVIYKF